MTALTLLVMMIVICIGGLLFCYHTAKSIYRDEIKRMREK